MRNITYHRQQPTHDHDERFRGGRLQNHTWYPYLGKPINLEILYSYDPQFVLIAFPRPLLIGKMSVIVRLLRIHTQERFITLRFRLTMVLASGCGSKGKGIS